MNEDKPKAYPIINKNNCKACGRCILYCKKNCLVLSKGINNKGYQYAEYTGEGCIGCGDCYYTCPEPLAIEVHIPVQKRNYKGE
jgi:2-oxoisovalerate ferredoxin oxidoreductase delta subunit